MALDGTYTGLQASILQWTDRAADPTMIAVVPDIITLFEATANKSAAIRTQFNRTSTQLTATVNQNYVSTPADYMATDSLFTNYTNNIQEVISYAGASALYKQYPAAQSAPGTPKGYITLVGKLEIAPSPDYAYTMPLYYYQKIPPLVTNPTGNWLLTNFPDIYLFGSLVASEAFLGSSADITKWGSLYDNAIQELQGATSRNQYGGGALSVKVDAVA